MAMAVMTTPYSRLMFSTNDIKSGVEQSWAMSGEEEDLPDWGLELTVDPERAKNAGSVSSASKGT